MNLESGMQSEGSLLAFDETDSRSFPSPRSYSQLDEVCRGRPFVPSPWTETVGPQLLPSLALRESSEGLHPGPRTTPTSVFACVTVCLPQGWISKLGKETLLPLCVGKHFLMPPCCICLCVWYADESNDPLLLARSQSGEAGSWKNYWC